MAQGDDRPQAPHGDRPDGTGEDLLAQARALSQKLGQAREEIGRRIIGQDEVIDEVLAALLSGGHALLVGLPGLGKTRLVETLGTVLALSPGRVQFTPDLMPADILGSEVLEEGPDGSRSFRFLPGPVFCQVLLADEINRASPRTQSALLQAMQEHQVTVAGHPHPLPEPFHVLATQNPIEQEGTYPLPEAQLDRFLLQVDVPYPSREAERQIVLVTTGAEEARAAPALAPGELARAQALVRRMPVGERVTDLILDLVRACRPGQPETAPELGDAIAWGPGPRASQALMLLVRARALLQGRLAPDTGDVRALARPVLQHRMALTYAARARGESLPALIEATIERLAQEAAAA